MKWTIRNAREKDIKQIWAIEKRVGKNWAATQETIRARLLMFPDGFLIAESGNRVIGYIESCLWKKSPFDTSNEVRFEEIKDFPRWHNPKGKILYGIFLAVEEKYRKRGIGSSLVKALLEYANNHYIKKILLVALPKRVKFYERLGFEAGRFLPTFLPNGYIPDAEKARLMEYKMLYYIKNGKCFTMLQFLS